MRRYKRAFRHETVKFRCRSQDDDDDDSYVITAAKYTVNNILRAVAKKNMLVGESAPHTDALNCHPLPR